MLLCFLFSSLFFFNDTATTEIYTLSLHDALPISRGAPRRSRPLPISKSPTRSSRSRRGPEAESRRDRERSEEHTSELQSPDHLVCRLLLEKKKKHQDSHQSKAEVGAPTQPEGTPP